MYTGLAFPKPHCWRRDGRTWLGIVVTDNFDVLPVARTPGVSHEYAVEGHVAVPEARESNFHHHRARACGIEACLELAWLQYLKVMGWSWKGVCGERKRCKILKR